MEITSPFLDNELKKKIAYQVVHSIERCNGIAANTGMLTFRDILSNSKLQNYFRRQYAMYTFFDTFYDHVRPKLARC